MIQPNSADHKQTYDIPKVGASSNDNIFCPVHCFAGFGQNLGIPNSLKTVKWTISKFSTNRS